MINSTQKLMTLGVLSKEWLNFNQNILKRSTLQTYKYMVNKHILLKSISSCSIDKIDTDDLIKYTNELLENSLSPKTVNSVLLTLNSIFKYGKLKYNFKPPYIQYVREKKVKTRVLSVSEQKILEENLRNNFDNFKLGILFALYTGVRIGELCALKWGDIKLGTVKIDKTMYRLKDDNGKSSIFINEPKTSNSNRLIPLPDFLIEIVEKYRKRDGVFFLSNKQLCYIEPRLMQKKFKKIIEMCGLKGVTFHTLRHTFATRCIECGFDAKTLSEILGHADVKTTLNRYVHSSLELKKNSMNMLSDIAV